jgi:hypothetical protein
MRGRRGDLAARALVVEEERDPHVGSAAMPGARAFTALAVATLAACHGGAPGAGGEPTAPATGGAPGAGSALVETFESPLPDAAFAPDAVPDDGPWSDAGVYFTKQGISPPAAFRASQPFGDGGWLTLESYTRREGAKLSDFASVVPDPANPANHVLRIRSPAHTDATVVRPTRPLPARYKISLGVGFPSFGDGAPPNGYAGGESAEPWLNADATTQNGFYWLAILDAMPRPHNNVYIHHHRKVVVDSDNHPKPWWIDVWNGSSFVPDGSHPVTMFALDGTSAGAEHSGNPFLSWSNGAWQPSGAIRAVDAYLPAEWYRVSIERDGPSYTIEVSGRFRFGGQTTYRATIDAAERCVWHYPVSAEEAAAASRCVDDGFFSAIGASYPNWPAGAWWPDWFMLGDPHANFYEGEVLYDDVKLEIP